MATPNTIGPAAGADSPAVKGIEVTPKAIARIRIAMQQEGIDLTKIEWAAH